MREAGEIRNLLPLLQKLQQIPGCCTGMPAQAPE